MIRSTAGPVYKQPISIQHQQLPSQFLHLDQSMLANNGSASNSFGGHPQPYLQQLHPQPQHQQQQQPQDGRYHSGHVGAPAINNSGGVGTFSSEVRPLAFSGVFLARTTHLPATPVL